MERLTVPGTIDSLERIGQYVTEVALAAGLDRKATYRLRLAIDELATNVITYGYQRSGLTGTIDLWTEIDDERLTLSIEDSAIPFDPTALPVPHNLGDPLEERKIGGLGIFLARRNVDEFRYERVDGRNRTILVVNRTVEEPQKAQQG
jgi:anti-sigma regulatory factor (Ser/Thr protein kinase)